MNVYQELEILKDPAFAAYFAEAEERREEISAIIFNKDRIMNFSREYDVFSEEKLGYLMDAIDEILDDEGYTSLCCAMYIFTKNDMSVVALKPQDEDSLKFEFALLPPLLANAVDFCEDARGRGVERDILTATFKTMSMYLDTNVKRTGRVGVSGYYHWLPLYGRGKLLKIGDFQFEIRSFRGENALGVHIPTGTKLDVKENMENFGRAFDFFNKYYSEYDFEGFVCESWLLNPHIEAIMGKKTNITRFGDMFDRFEIDEEDDGVYICVFGVLTPKNIDELCEETSLQKNIKKFVKEGNRFKDYGGFLSFEKFEEAIKSI